MQLAPRLKILSFGLVTGTIFTALVALFLTAGLPVRSAKAADTTSYIRVIHASPDIGTATVFVDGDMLLNNFQFGTVTPYAPLPAGPHKVQVGLIGTGPGAATITQTVQIQPGVPYTVAALGTAATGFSLQVFIDDNLVVSGSAKLRVYHLSPGTGTVSVATNGSTVINAISYQQASSYLSEPAGAYTFDVSSSESNTTLPVSAKLDMNTVTSVFAIGLLNGTPKIQFVSAQVKGLPGVPGTGSDPNYRVAHDAVQPVIAWLPEIALLFLTGGFLYYRLRRVKRA